MAPRKLRNYVRGEWYEPKDRKWLEVENPSTGDIIAQAPLSTTEDTNAAVEAAHAAFPAWAATPVDKRVAPLFKLAGMIRQNHETLARSITEENGKSLPDARAEVDRILENVETACGMPVLQQGDKLVGAAPGIDGEVIRLPMGVFAMIAPFNFPGMVPFWFVPYALATGNTYVVKPSKQVPCTMQLLGEYIDACGFPKGVFNIVNGDRVVADAFMAHPRVQGVSLVGSTPTARLVAETCARNNKRFQAMGGAKNHLVVMPDAKMDDVVRNMITSGYGCAGQRCMASSAIVCVGDAVYRDTIERFVAASKKVIVANPLDPKVARETMVMGPVISAKARAFILKMIDTGVKEGATLALDGRGVKVPGCEKGHFVGTTVFTDVKPGMQIHKTEIFGPVQVILKAGTLDEAIRIVNDHEYGNGASIYTQNGYYARRFKLEAQVGMVGVNVGIPAPVAYLPFGGMKSSQFADIKAQGKAVVNFFTQDKIITERYWPEA
ncbi:MAG TPA: CoA-acylating methylmalonate-semialdehyde dehydrogenase [Candidatus Polarisedimenticolia bacterium]|nr:CoA-acylating methylmalonate-semialdehyde dehydrogenase [Candidatus Polarisedimenticolia bacterium]